MMSLDLEIILGSIAAFLILIVFWYIAGRKNPRYFTKYDGLEIKRSQNPKDYFCNILKRKIEIADSCHLIWKRYFSPIFILLGILLVVSLFPYLSKNILPILLGLIIVVPGLLAPGYIRLIALSHENKDLSKEIRKLFDKYADPEAKRNASMKRNIYLMIENLHDKFSSNKHLTTVT